MASVVNVDGQPVLLSKNLVSVRRLGKLRGELEQLAESPHPIPQRCLDHAVDEITEVLDSLFTPGKESPILSPSLATAIATIATAVVVTVHLFV